MKTKTKENKPSAEEVLLRDVIGRINDILKETNTVLRPFLDVQDFGIRPMVRVEIAPKQEDIAKTI